MSRKASSRVLVTDDAESFTSFPDPSTSAAKADDTTLTQPLYGLLDDHGPSMFDDPSAIDANDPQTLSAAPHAVLQEVVKYHGAIELVQRLSLMLAERDAHITALTRLAEEYNVPKQRISDAASRAKQAERRRLSIAAASEDLSPPSAVGSVGSTSQESGTSKSTRGSMPPPKGITKLFAGAPRKPKPAPIKQTEPQTSTQTEAKVRKATIRRCTEYSQCRKRGMGSEHQQHVRSQQPKQAIRVRHS